jgi:hypothetical protein
MSQPNEPEAQARATVSLAAKPGKDANNTSAALKSDTNHSPNNAVSLSLSLSLASRRALRASAVKKRVQGFTMSAASPSPPGFPSAPYETMSKSKFFCPGITSTYLFPQGSFNLSAEST